MHGYGQSTLLNRPTGTFDAGQLSSGTVPNAQISESSVTQFRDQILTGIEDFNFDSATELTISSGAITITQATHTVDTESDAAADDLDTINGAINETFLLLRPENTGRDITLKHGTGNILTADGNDFTIPDNGTALLWYDGTNWRSMIGSGTDPDAIHNNVAGEISAVTEKATPHDNDLFLMEDSEDSNNKKRVKLTNLPGFGGTDTDAIHDNVSGEIAAVTAKSTPVGADVILLEDSAASNAKKSLSLLNAKTFMHTDIGTLNLNASSELTISSGAITATQTTHTIDTESDAAADDLDTITAAVAEGDLLFLEVANSGRITTLKHGTGNIVTPDGNDLVMTANGTYLLKYDGTNWRVIGGGNTGGGGKILQIQDINKSSTFSTTSTSFTDVTGLSVSITPSSTSSKILIIANIQISSSDSVYPHQRMMRGATPINVGDAAGSRKQSGWSGYAQGASNGVWVYSYGGGGCWHVDSPSTTSATTYKFQVAVSSGTVYVNRLSGDVDSSVTGRVASNIILLEVGE